MHIQNWDISFHFSSRLLSLCLHDWLPLCTPVFCAFFFLVFIQFLHLPVHYPFIMNNSRRKQDERVAQDKAVLYIVSHFLFFLSSLIQLTQLKRQTQGYNTLLFPKYSLSIRSVIQQFLYNLKLYKPHKTLIHILFSLFPTNVFLFLKTRQAFLYLAWFYSPLSLHSFCYVRAP